MKPREGLPGGSSAALGRSMPFKQATSQVNLSVMSTIEEEECGRWMPQSPKTYRRTNLRGSDLRPLAATSPSRLLIVPDNRNYTTRYTTGGRASLACASNRPHFHFSQKPMAVVRLQYRSAAAMAMKPQPRSPLPMHATDKSPSKP